MPKRGGLKPAGKRQESATFLQRSFFDVAVQFFACCSAALVKMTFALQKSECCSATSAAQHSENCSATSVFACGMLQGWGLVGWGLGLPDFFLLLGREPCGDRILRSCLQKGPATAPANRVPESLPSHPGATLVFFFCFAAVRRTPTS